MTQPKIRLFVSDMDSTMIAAECIDKMAEKLDEENKKQGIATNYAEQVKAITSGTMNQASMPFDESLRTRIDILAKGGFKEAWLGDIYKDIRPMEGAEDLLNHLNDNGVHSVLVSGGFTYFAERVAKRLGFKEFHANVLEFDADGTLSGVHGPEANGGNILDGAGKLKIMTDIMTAKNVASHEVCAIGDGSNDALMVKAAGYGIAFRAENTTLKAAANLPASHLKEVPALLAGPARSQGAARG